jgi:diaminopimelate epimerase
MYNFEVQKYTGAGNNFLMINNLENSVSDLTKITKEIIAQDGNSGYDGVIFIEQSDIADFRMNYYNKDGSGNTLCGNGLRATFKYLLDNRITNKNQINLEAVNRIYQCNVQENEMISVKFPEPSKIKLKFKLKVHFAEWWQLLTVSYLNLGSPHIVVFIDDIENPVLKNIDEVDIIEWGRNIRMHKDLSPEGANVNFIEIIDFATGELKIRSYERGVEGETLACGTGALSSAIAAYFLKQVSKPVKLLTKSGEYLIVNFDYTDDSIRNLYLTGSANRII